MSARRGYPKPPLNIWAELESAGRENDPVRLGLARAAYAAWLVDHGYTQPRQGRIEHGNGGDA